jgi:hypothetical protein
MNSGAGGGGKGREGNESKGGRKGKPSEGADKTRVRQKQDAQPGDKRMRPNPGGDFDAVISDATKNEVVYLFYI